MNDQDVEKAKDQKNWLREHDSIQVDLLKMKDEFLSEVRTDRGPEKDTRRPVPKVDAPPASPKPSPAEKRTETVKAPSELTIKQMLGGSDGSSKREAKDPCVKEAPRMSEGQIPSSPDLTEKIANVLQLEDKLKRRKFELEKRSRGKDIPPPPRRPVVDEETVLEEVGNGLVEETHEIELTRYAEEDLGQTEDTLHHEVQEKGKDESISTPLNDPEVDEGRDGRKGDGEVETKKKDDVKEERRSHKEERKKKRRGIWALFGRG